MIQMLNRVLIKFELFKFWPKSNLDPNWIHVEKVYYESINLRIKIDSSDYWFWLRFNGVHLVQVVSQSKSIVSIKIKRLLITDGNTYMLSNFMTLVCIYLYHRFTTIQILSYIIRWWRWVHSHSIVCLGIKGGNYSMMEMATHPFHCSFGYQGGKQERLWTSQVGLLKEFQDLRTMRTQ